MISRRPALSVFLLLASGLAGASEPLRFRRISHQTRGFARTAAKDQLEPRADSLDRVAIGQRWRIAIEHVGLESMLLGNQPRAVDLESRISGQLCSVLIQNPHHDTH